MFNKICVKKLWRICSLVGTNVNRGEDDILEGISDYC